MSEIPGELRDAILARIHAIPIVKTLDMKILSLGDGTCDARVPRSSAYDGVYKSFHGGLLMTVADTAACFAVFTKTGAEAQMTTTDMGIRFLAPCLSDLTARARIIKFGRTLSPVHVDLYDADDKHVAVAQVNYFILDRIPHRSK